MDLHDQRVRISTFEISVRDSAETWILDAAYLVSHATYLPDREGDEVEISSTINWHCLCSAFFAASGWIVNSHSKPSISSAQRY